MRLDASQLMISQTDIEPTSIPKSVLPALHAAQPESMLASDRVGTPTRDQNRNVGRFSVGRMRISAVNMDSALQMIDEQAQRRRSAYVCVANVRATVQAQKDREFCEIENSSFLTLPDGMPLVWYARLSRAGDVSKVSGPDIMMRSLSVSEQRGYSHYFYGSTPAILEQMKANITQRCGKLDIKAMVSPPFRPLTQDEKDETARDINRLKPTFVWVGLGAPKQEKWMRDMIDRIDSAILIGVGAAFPFAAGVVRRPPRWVSSIGLEWLFRCMQQPITAKRFIKPFFVFNGMLVARVLQRILGRI